MSGGLFRSELVKGLRTVASYGIGMVFYVWLFIWIYPSFARARALTSLLRSMPPGLLKVVGYTVGATRLSGFLGGEFYSLLYLLIFAVFVIFTATRLVAHLVDNGSMAYLLATPVSRRAVATTQVLVLVTDVVIIGAMTAGGGLLGVHWLLGHSELKERAFLETNLVGTLLFAVVAGYSFLVSCAAPDERTALGLSTVLTLLFYGLHVVGDVSSRAAFLAHASLFSAFDSAELIRGQGHFLREALRLALTSVILYATGISTFRRRQLPL
ncbi:MAG: ABC transporter permease subunit [Clostridia bacterium]